MYWCIYIPISSLLFKLVELQNVKLGFVYEEKKWKKGGRETKIGFWEPYLPFHLIYLFKTIWSNYTTTLSAESKLNNKYKPRSKLVLGFGFCFSMSSMLPCSFTWLIQLSMQLVILGEEWKICKELSRFTLTVQCHWIIWRTTSSSPVNIF